MNKDVFCASQEFVDLIQSYFTAICYLLVPIHFSTDICYFYPDI